MSFLQCPSCRTRAGAGDVVCRRCGVALASRPLHPEAVRSIMTATGGRFRRTPQARRPADRPSAPA